MESMGHQLTFQFQSGLKRDKVTVSTNDLNLKSVKSLAADFVQEKYPTNGITRLQERILLFRHDYHSTNVLQVSSGSTLDTTVVRGTQNFTFKVNFISRSWLRNTKIVCKIEFKSKFGFRI